MAWATACMLHQVLQGGLDVSNPTLSKSCFALVFMSLNAEKGGR